MKIPEVIETLRKTHRNGVSATSNTMREHASRLAAAHEKLRTADGGLAQALEALQQAVLAKDDSRISKARTALDAAFAARDTARKSIDALVNGDLPGLKDLGDLGNSICELAPAVLWLSEHIAELPPEMQRKFFDAVGRVGAAE